MMSYFPPPQLNLSWHLPGPKILWVVLNLWGLYGRIKRKTYRTEDFDILLTVHLSIIYFSLFPTWYTVFPSTYNICYSLSSTCFRPHRPIIRRSKLHMQPMVLLLLYKCVLKPVWTYGIQLWGCAKPSHKKSFNACSQKFRGTSPTRRGMFPTSHYTPTYVYPSLLQRSTGYLFSTTNGW